MKSTVAEEEACGIVRCLALWRKHAVLLVRRKPRLQVLATILILSTIGLLAIVTPINPYVINAGRKTEGTAS